jgi:hypothetical protein
MQRVFKRYGDMKKKTAVDWLVEQYTQGNYSWEAYEQAKEMEKEQIVEAYESGVWDVGCRNSDSKKYYNETYGDK